MIPENKYYKEWVLIHNTIINKLSIPKEFLYVKTINNFLVFCTYDTNMLHNKYGFILFGNAVRADSISKDCLSQIRSNKDLDKLCGNYAVINKDKLFGDHFGATMIFYHSNRKVVSSSLTLIKELFNLKCVNSAIEHIEICCGHYTPVKNVCFLSSASEYIQINKNKIRILNKKIFNYKKHIKKTRQERIEKILFYFQNIYANIYNKYDKVYTTLSAGFHSRLALAYQLKSVDKRLINPITVNVQGKLHPNSVIPQIICKKIRIPLKIHEIKIKKDKKIDNNKLYYELDKNADYKWLDDELSYLMKKNNCLLKHFIFEIPSNFFDNRLDYFIIQDIYNEDINLYSLKKQCQNYDDSIKDLIKKNIKFFKKTVKHLKQNSYINWLDYHYIFYRPIFLGMSESNLKPCKYDTIAPANNKLILDLFMSFTKEERDYNNPDNIWIEIMNSLNLDLMKIPINSFNNCRLGYKKYMV